MLVCNVSLRARRSPLAETAEAGAALDDVNGLFGSILSEAASADAAATVGALYTIAIVEVAGAADTSDAAATSSISADVLDAATADSAQDAATVSGAVARNAMLPGVMVNSDGAVREANADGVMVNL